MQAIIPSALSILNDSVPEPDTAAGEPALWDAATAYHAADAEAGTVADRVMDDHYIYVALEDSAGAKPSENSDVSGAPWRTEKVGNKYACIDLYRYTKTVAPQGAAELVIQIPFNRPATALGLLNIAASTMSAVLTDSTGAVAWQREADLLEDSVDWWAYYFDTFRYTGDKVFTGIPPVTGTMTITLSAGFPIWIGSIIAGELVELGRTEYGARTGFVDYSVNTVDAFGNEVFSKRRNARRGEFTCYSPPSEMAYIQRVTQQLAGTPTLWIGDDAQGFENMIVQGFVREFGVALDAWSRTSVTFEIRGIV